jgi:hypothetical protein
MNPKLENINILCHTIFNFKIYYPSSFLRTFNLCFDFTTMSVSENFWLEETSLKMSSSKRQKTDPEIMIKIECLDSTSDQSFKKHVVLLQMITAMASYDVKVLNKKSEILEDSSILALNEELI